MKINVALEHLYSVEAGLMEVEGLYFEDVFGLEDVDFEVESILMDVRALIRKLEDAEGL